MSTNGTDRPRPHRSPALSDDYRRAIRKLSRNGNSLTVSLPPELVLALHLLPGDDLELVYDREWQGIFVHALRPRVFRPIGIRPPEIDRG